MSRPSLREFLKSFQPLLYVLKISGLLTNEMREVKGKLIATRSIFGTIQTLVFIVLYSGMVCFMNINEIVIFRLSGISMVIENIQLFSFALTFYIVVVSAIIKERGFLRIVESISELDTLIFQLGEDIDYEKEFKRNVIFVGIFYTTTGGNGLVEFCKKYQPGFEYIFHTLVWFVPSFILHLMLLQFVILVFSLKLRCSRLNNAMSKMINFTNKQNLGVIPNIEIECEYSHVKYHSSNIVGTIWNMSVIYDMICDICGIINKVFSFQTTIGLGVTSIFLTFMIYEYAMVLKEVTHFYEWTAILNGIQFILIHGITIFVVIYCCNGAKSEGERVGILLHKVKPKRVEHREAISAFSLQSMHQKVQFTACGLFNLDSTFIYLLISTISTYIVILVQFGETHSP